jgi:hypothetical protein
MLSTSSNAPVADDSTTKHTTEFDCCRSPSLLALCAPFFRRASTECRHQVLQVCRTDLSPTFGEVSYPDGKRRSSARSGEI